MLRCAEPDELSNDLFRDEDVLNGTEATEALRDQPGRVWVDIDNESHSLRFYGRVVREDRNPLILLEGDRLRGTNKRGDLRVIGRHGEESARMKQRKAEQTAIALDRTFVNLARPGVFGSTGDHGQRRRRRETEIVNAAISHLKEVFGWSRLNIAGQSGGGHLVGMLLSLREDIDHAVIASGNVAVWQRLREKGLAEDMTGYGDPVDPIDHVNVVAQHAPKSVIMLTDLRDKAVSATSQTAYFEALKKAGINVVQRHLPGDGDEHHGLMQAALLAAADFDP